MKVFITRSEFTFVAQNEQEAKQLIDEWIKGLIDNESILEGEVIFVRPITDELDFDPFPKEYNYNGPDNYPGHPL